MKTANLQLTDRKQIQYVYNKSNLADLIRQQHNNGLAKNVRVKDAEAIWNIISKRMSRQRAAHGKTIRERLFDRLKIIVPNDRTSRCSVRDGYIADYNPHQHMWVVCCDGELETRHKTWFYHAAWLCGRDDGRYFTHRVPARCNTILAAIDYLMPATVKRAKNSGKQILRQGDVWLVESVFRTDNIHGLPWSHTWHASKRDLVHPEHGTLHVPFTFRVYQNKSIRGGRAD